MRESFKVDLWGGQKGESEKESERSKEANKAKQKRNLTGVLEDQARGCGV